MKGLELARRSRVVADTPDGETAPPMVLISGVMLLQLRKHHLTAERPSCLRVRPSLHARAMERWHPTHRIAHI